MRHFCDQWIQEWCDENGWTDLFIERYNNYWAFPPGAVMPEPIPNKVLRLIKLEKGLCEEEKAWLGVALGFTALAVTLTCFWATPMPIVVAFAFDAFTAAQLEVEYS